MLPGLPKQNHPPKERKPDHRKAGHKLRGGFRFRKTISSIISNACGSTRKNGGGEANMCVLDQPKGNMGKILQELERELRGTILIDDEKPNEKNGFGIRGVKTIDVKNSDEEEEEKVMQKEDDIGELELCKKRILMGGKCRPLNSSGVLRYDENGIFVADDVSSKS